MQFGWCNPKSSKSLSLSPSLSPRVQSTSMQFNVISTYFNSIFCEYVCNLCAYYIVIYTYILYICQCMCVRSFSLPPKIVVRSKILPPPGLPVSHLGAHKSSWDRAGLPDRVAGYHQDLTLWKSEQKTLARLAKLFIIISCQESYLNNYYVIIYV